MSNFLKLLLLLCLPCAGSSQVVSKTPVWKQGEDSIFAYFVYGLTVTQKGTILAFAEARISNSADEGPHHIVMRRSTDEGNSFSASVILVESKNGESWANPTVVEDQQTKEIFLFYALNDKNASTRVFYISSKDDGLNWSPAIELSHLFEKNTHGWTFHLPGPGHGIQLRSQRLIVPVWHRRSISFPAKERKYGVNCLYSDDHGKTWKAGGDTPVGELNESQIVEQKNGDVLLIGRTYSGLNGVWQAAVVSKDGGINWSAPIDYVAGLTGKVCDIGLARYSFRPDILLVSQPADPGKRKDLTIRMSRDGGKTWPISRLLEAGGATYSDLVVLRNKTIVCLYGHGGTEHMPQAVSLARFNLTWLQTNTK
ncbi:exo-alpha-sialidase [Pseudoflavitalea sp. X16]|uniref:sialidase family protein n=1 Tax=Paraflavitalea devenefica TaxID=2716334 RepID=UPI0014224B2F|nr:sialidase family protein [Paraflavitalea devenefica]NII29370.1 exo-alpha-sialidase [Paraflavitalea devenefica]